MVMNLFFFQIINCSVVGYESFYPCSVDTSVIKIVVFNEEGALNENKNVLGDLPTWIWYPIAAGIIIMPLLGWFGYRFYKKRKYAEEKQHLRDIELNKEQEGMDDIANFGGIGDNIQFNPLATGGAQSITTGGEYIDRQLSIVKKEYTTAVVDVEEVVYRQDFGPVQPNRNT